jgi:enoyl-CoA hydratase/carnithine racemase
MDYSQIIFKKMDQIALITLNRPEKLNAWTYRMMAELVDAISKSNNDPDIGAIVMTGAGKGFCAGADMQDTLKDRMDGGNPQEQARQTSNETAEPENWVDVVRKAKPLIAAVNGAAVGIGMTQILPFDIIIASDRAKFGMFFIKMGLVPELASTHFLVQRMGFGRASEMVLSGRLYGAREAFDKGLVDRLSTHENLMEETLKVAGEIGANPTRQLRLIKHLITLNGSETDLALAAAREAKIMEECFSSPEHKEAVTAFLEKRPPKFR